MLIEKTCRDFCFPKLEKELMIRILSTDFSSSTAFLQLSLSIMTSPEVWPYKASPRENAPKWNSSWGPNSKLHKASRKSHCTYNRATMLEELKRDFCCCRWAGIVSLCLLFTNCVLHVQSPSQGQVGTASREKRKAPLEKTRLEAGKSHNKRGTSS